MPVRRRKDPEEPTGSSSLDIAALLRTQTLTVELLDWVIASLEAVLSTPQVADYKRQQQALTTALKQADYLYPAAYRGDRSVE